MIVVTAAAILLAGWSTLIEPYRRQAAGLDRLSDLYPPSASFATPSNSIEDSWHRILIEFAVGEEAALKIRAIQIPGGTNEEDARFILSKMRFLSSVDVSETNVSEDVARILAGMPELTELFAVRSNIGDAAIAELSRSDSIRTMRLTANPFGDESVVSLAGMQQLDEIFLRWTKITPDGFETLRGELPDCAIWFQARAPH